MPCAPPHIAVLLGGWLQPAPDISFKTAQLSRYIFYTIIRYIGFTTFVLKDKKEIIGKIPGW